MTQLDLLEYPPTGGHHPATSFEAAERIQSRIANMRDRIEDFVLSCGPRGAIREEVEVALEMKTQTLCPRLNELQKRYQRLIVHGKRKTTSGCNAQIYVHVRFSDEISREK